MACHTKRIEHACTLEVAFSAAAHDHQCLLLRLQCVCVCVSQMLVACRFAHQ